MRSDQPPNRDAWVTTFVHEVLQLRPDLSYSHKYAATVALNEWVRTKAIDPQVAARQWNERVKSARP